VRTGQRQLQRSPEDWADFDYDFKSSKIVNSPHDVWRRLQDEMPVIYSRAHDGYWFACRYSEVIEILTDWQTFSSAQGVVSLRGGTLLIPQEMDPPDHRKYRSVLNVPLSPKQMPAHEGWIRAEARKQLATVVRSERFELLSAFAVPFPKIVALRLMGFPEQDLAELDGWVTNSIMERGSEAATLAGAALYGYLTTMLQERAEHLPKDDLISVVQNGQVDGAPIPVEDQISMLMLLLFGGLHTTTSALAGAIVWLADHPEDRARLKAQPGLMTTAVDEFVRFTSPADTLSRVVTTDTELAGCPIKKGDRVMFGLGAANRDPREFDHPESVDLARYPNRHLGFGSGPHRCVGAHLAKLQLRVGLEESLSAFPNFEVEDHSALRWEGGEPRGLINVPIRVTER
jgi:cytochrome P450